MTDFGSHKSFQFPNNNSLLNNNQMNFNNNNNMSMNININNMNIMPNMMNNNMRMMGNNMGMMNNNMRMMNNNMGMMNNNMRPDNYYLPSNLVGNNVIHPISLPFNPFNNQQQNNFNNDYLSLRFNLNNVYYILKIERIDSSASILFSCHNEDDITLLYEYSCSKSFRELHNMSKTFQICDNIGQIFKSIENTLINDKNKAIPRIDFFQNNNEALVFFFRIPLISGQIEDINIILQKKERNIKMQFDILAERYEKIKEIVLSFDKPDNKVSKLNKLIDPSGFLNQMKWIFNPSN